ncbi:MAG: YolD-like family protein [Burkholderiaceae bacterium]|nr:YolD-like family protein [Burkholderiaceae bacterium]
MSTPYDDIIHLPRPISKNHLPMPREKRASQFAPFSALSGYSSAIEEASRITIPRPELDIQELELLNIKLFKALSKNLSVKLTIFVPDDLKDGGSLKNIQTQIKKIDEFHQQIVLISEEKIPLENILQIDF